MRNWRVLTAVTAVVLAALAALLAYRYLDDADERAQEDVELVGVLVAKGDIPRGTTGQAAIDADLFETREVPRNAVPDMARDNTEGIADLVASSKVGKGQFIVYDTFVEPSRLEGFSSSLPEGKQAISLTVDAMRGVAGFVVPNDTVSLIVTLEVEDLVVPAEGSNVTQTPPLTTTAFLIPGVKVLAVDDTTITSPAASTAPAEGSTEGETSSAAPASSATFTLEVTPRQALQIAHAMQGEGQVYLSLNPPGFEAKDLTLPAEIVEAYNWFDQELTKLDEVRAEIRAASSGLPTG